MNRLRPPIGPKDSLLSAFVGIQAFLIVSAMTIEAGKLAGFAAGGGLTAALTLGIAASCGIEILRRRILFGSPNAHTTMAPIYQKLIRNMLLFAVLSLVIAVVGLASGCFGHACGDFDEFVLGFALFLSLLAVCLSPLTLSLARHAIWLKASS